MKGVFYRILHFLSETDEVVVLVCPMLADELDETVALLKND